MSINFFITKVYFKRLLDIMKSVSSHFGEWKEMKNLTMGVK